MEFFIEGGWVKEGFFMSGNDLKMLVFYIVFQTFSSR